MEVFLFNHLESHNPIFFIERPLPFFWVTMALIVWSHLCGSCYGFLRLFQQIVEKVRFCYGQACVRASTFFLRFFQQHVEKMRFCYG